MRRFFALIGLALAVLPGIAARAAQPGPNDAAIQKAIAYIRTQQAADGTFAGFGPGSTADAIYALVAAGVNVAEVKNGQASALDGLIKQTPEAAKKTGLAAKYVLAALLTGQDPHALGGTDLVAVVQNGRNSTTNQYGDDVTSHALSLLALRAAGVTVPSETIVALERMQLPDSGWSFDGRPETGSDTNTTALALQALVSTGGTSEAQNKAIAYLHAQQNDDGGFPYSQTSQFGHASDANSTALALQAILAVKQPLSAWTKSGKTPLDRLLAFQNASGAFRFQDTPPDDNQGATYQAVPPIAGKSYPIEAILIAQPAVATPTTAPGDVAATPLPATNPVSTTTPLLVATPVATSPARLPDTGGSAVPVLLCCSLGYLSSSLESRYGVAAHSMALQELAFSTADTYWGYVCLRGLLLTVIARRCRR